MQCLASIQPLVEYMQSQEFISKMSEMKQKQKGYITREFALLLQQMLTSSKPLNPERFLSAVSSSTDLFPEDSQHDSQEFLCYILDAIHEDLNGVLHKPYREMADFTSADCVHKVAQAYWTAHSAREQSIITHLFHAQFLQRVECTQCESNSVKCEVFSVLSLDIPQTHKMFYLVKECNQFEQDACGFALNVKPRDSISDVISHATKVLQLDNTQSIDAFVWLDGSFLTAKSDAQVSNLGHIFLFVFLNSGIYVLNTLSLSSTTATKSSLAVCSTSHLLI